MKIGIEAQRIFRKKKHGMDFVALELIRALQVIDQENEYFIFVKPDEDRHVLQLTPNFHLVEVPGGPYPVWEQFYLPQAAHQAGVDVLHCTSNTAPLSLKIPLIVTLHDIIYLEKLHLRKGTWYQRLGNLYRRWNVPRMLPHCEKILTVSHFENQRITRALGLPPTRVTTLYNAAGGHFQPITDEARLAFLREKYQLPARFILFLGNTDPKKNVPNVLKALWLLKQRGQLPCPVVMPDYGATYLNDLLKQVGAERLREDLHLCGYIPNDELPGLYNLASTFLYPSLRESFGIPILEAMACGTPVITSTTSSMPEVAGEAALLIDPTQPEALAQAIHLLATDRTVYEACVAKGLARAKQFSWTETAKHVLKIYEGTVEQTAVASENQLRPATVA